MSTIPFTQTVVNVSRRRPAPKQEPLERKRTRLKLLGRTLLDAFDRHERGLRGDSASAGIGIWEQGSYAELQSALDRLRSNSGHRAKGLADCFWAVYVNGSRRHLERRQPKAELVLDWLERELGDVYVPAEISQAAGYLEHEAKKWTKPRMSGKLPDGFRGLVRPKTDASRLA
jgi:hypothetical protein